MAILKQPQKNASTTNCMRAANVIGNTERKLQTYRHTYFSR